MAKCNAKRSNGQPCNSNAMTGKTKCYKHGGATPSGIRSPHYKTGRYSKYLPDRLQGKYHEAQSDANLLALREDIALIDTRIAELLSQVDTGENQRTWEQLSIAHDDLREATKEEDGIAQTEAINRIGDLIKRGVGEQAAWDSVFAAIEQRRKLVESEHKRLIAMDQVITAERAMLLISAIAGIIKQNVTDKKVIDGITMELDKLLVVGDA